jgi:hypothetical protein
VRNKKTPIKTREKGEFNRKELSADEAVRQLIAGTSHQHIEAMTLDLASLDSIRRFAQEFTSGSWKVFPASTLRVCDQYILPRIPNDLEKAGELWRTSIRLAKLTPKESFLPPQGE